MRPQGLIIRIAQVGWLTLTIIPATLLVISISVFLDYQSNYGNNPTLLPDLQPDHDLLSEAEIDVMRKTGPP
jgi:hypothetical protein